MSDLFKEGHVFLVAELSANHGHSLETALKTVDAAAASGADAIKLQTYTADTITIDCDNEYFRIDSGTIWDGRNLHDLYKEAYTPWEWHEPIQKRAHELGIEFFSTPFDNTAVDFLDNMDVPCYKIASFEVTDIPLIGYAASKGKPMIISTGIATVEEIQDAVEACYKAGNMDVILLKCTSSYPAPIEDANLSSIIDIREKFGVKVGLSDHTEGFASAVAAAALGAVMVEKHFILDRSIGGPDASFSMNPEEFKQMADVIRNIEKAMGRPSYNTAENPPKGRVFARSLFVVEDIKAGEEFNAENVRSIRPFGGILPKHLPDVIGKKAVKDIKKGTPLSFDMLK